MIRVINFDNVNCCCGNKILLRNLNFSVEKGSFVSIVGETGSGKSTLVKVMAGLLPYNGYININGYCLDSDNIYNIRKNVRVVFGDMDSYFVGNTVYEELDVGLENMGTAREKIKKDIDKVVKEFGLESIVSKEIVSLTNSEKQMVSLASALVCNPSILIMDDCLNKLSSLELKRVLDIICDYRKKKKLTVIMVTHNMESVLCGNRVIVLNDGKVVMDGSTVSVLKQRDKLVKFGVGSTFCADMSIKLLNKGVINHIYLDMEKLVDRLWK